MEMTGGGKTFGSKVEAPLAKAFLSLALDTD